MTLGATYDLGQAQWFCFWENVYGAAIGTFDLQPPEKNFESDAWKYIAHYVSIYQYWDRQFWNPTIEDGDYCYERFACYVWDGKEGVSPFREFAEGMRNAPDISVGQVEYLFFTVNVHVKDGDGKPLAEAEVTVSNSTWSDTAITDENGNCTFYLRSGAYDFAAEYNETFEGTVYQTYTASLTGQDITDHTNITITINVVNFICHVVDAGGNNVQNANVSIWNITPTPKELLISKIVNLTAWAEFKVPPGTYNVTVHAEGSLQNETQYTINSYMEEEIECSNLHEKVTKIVVDNTTSISFTWTTGTVTIVARWINTSDDTQLNASALQDGYFQYRLKEGSTVIHDWTNISASGSGGNIYYVVNLTGVLFGGKVYTLEFRADASGYLSAFNQCSVSVALATPDIQVVGFAGKTFYWNASNIDLWVYVYDPENGFSVTEATVTYNIPGYLSGTLTHTGGGNYTGRPPDALPPGTYEIAFEVSCTNYSSQTESRILWIQNRPQT